MIAIRSTVRPPSAVGPEQQDATAPARTPVIVAALCSLSWLTALIVLTTVAGPIAVNQRQVRRADLIVSATVTDPATGRIHIEEVVAGEQPRSIDQTLANLPEQVTAGQKFLIPLWRDQRIVEVSDPRKRDSGRPVLYPDTPDIRARIQDALALGRIDE